MATSTTGKTSPKPSAKASGPRPSFKKTTPSAASAMLPWLGLALLLLMADQFTKVLILGY
ncbi:MAG: signal peptidase Aspartic peptidase family [Polaromonas sp.]|nr:signal peptidase Aspartic peptidase family [Polaromonas sp.]